jgi:hypothetical protein
MDLRKANRLSGRQGDGQTARVARPVDVTIRGDLERQPAARQADALGEAGCDGAPRTVPRPERDGRPPESPTTEPGQRAVVREPARKR